jgi:outer membrane murein-binding lipoprotein Lpp
MPLVAAAVIGGGALLAGSKIQSNALGKSTQLQTDAATRAAEIAAQAERESLAFKQQQAEQDRLNAESAQRGNYDQWRAREGRMSGLGTLLGLAPRDIPDYVPIPKAPPVSVATPTGHTIGMAKTFPNGRVGTWDGQGWAAH